MAVERDPLLRRVERTSIAACAAMAVVAWIAARGRLGAPIGVVGGGLLVAISYRGIKDGIDAVGDGAVGPRRRRTVAVGLVKFFTRYAILAVAAWAIMARLTVPPVAVIAGASSLVVAVGIEAFRQQLRGHPPSHTPRSGRL
jgi:small-conductance mechanosensitive channel